MLPEESGEPAVDAPQDDYVLHSEEVKAPEPVQENKPEAKPEVKTEEPAEETDSEEVKPKRPGGFQKKIARYEAQLAEKDAELERLRSGKQETPQAGKPSPDNFDTYDAYTEALADWKIDQKLGDRDKQSKQEQAKQEYASKLQSHAQRAQEFAKTTPDFADNVQLLLDEELVTPHLEAAVYDSEMGPQVLNYLAQNLDEAERLSGLGVLALNKAIGKIEAKLESQKVVAVKTTKAPPPVRPVSNGGKLPDIDLDTADMDTFTREREKEIRSRRGY